MTPRRATPRRRLLERRRQADPAALAGRLPAVAPRPAGDLGRDPPAGRGLRAHDRRRLQAALLRGPRRARRPRHRDRRPTPTSEGEGELYSLPAAAYYLPAIALHGRRAGGPGRLPVRARAPLRLQRAAAAGPAQPHARPSGAAGRRGDGAGQRAARRARRSAPRAPCPSCSRRSAAGKTVTFVYYSISRDEELERTVDPYGLLLVGDEWYLIALLSPAPGDPHLPALARALARHVRHARAPRLHAAPGLLDRRLSRPAGLAARRGGRQRHGARLRRTWRGGSRPTARAAARSRRPRTAAAPTTPARATAPSSTPPPTTRAGSSSPGCCRWARRPSCSSPRSCAPSCARSSRASPRASPTRPSRPDRGGRAARAPAAARSDARRWPARRPQRARPRAPPRPAHRRPAAPAPADWQVEVDRFTRLTALMTYLHGVCHASGDDDETPVAVADGLRRPRRHPGRAQGRRAPAQPRELRRRRHAGLGRVQGRHADRDLRLRELGLRASGAPVTAAGRHAAAGHRDPRRAAADRARRGAAQRRRQAAPRAQRRPSGRRRRRPACPPPSRSSTPSTPRSGSAACSTSSTGPRAAARAATRTVEPYLLVRTRGEWYYVAWCRRSQGTRIFRVATTKRALLRSERFEPRAEVEVELYRREGIRSSQRLRAAARHRVVRPRRRPLDRRARAHGRRLSGEAGGVRTGERAASSPCSPSSTSAGSATSCCASAARRCRSRRRPPSRACASSSTGFCERYA